MRALSLAALLGVTLGLAGCVSSAPADVPWTGAPAPATYALQGKVAWRSGTDRGSAALSWYQDEADFLLLLTGPLGRGMVELSGDDDAVVLSTEDSVRHAASPEALLFEVTGLRLPLAPARWWIRGRPAPGPGGVVDRDEAGRPLRIAQRGWLVDYGAWEAVEGGLLPTRLSMQRDDVLLRFVIGRWSLGDAAVAAVLGEAGRG